jgi:hypothetical protein
MTGKRPGKTFYRRAAEGAEKKILSEFLRWEF